MGDGHGGTDRDHVAQPAASPDQVGRHDRLAMPGQERVPGAEQHRQQHGEQADADGEVFRADGVVERGREPVELTDQNARDGQVLGDPVGRRARTGHGGQCAAAHVERRAEQVVRVAAQLVADAPGRERGVLQRDVGRDRGDLVPADALAVPGAVDLHGRLARQVDPPRQLALEPAGGELDDAGSLDIAAAHHRHRDPVAANHDRQGPGHRPALPLGVRRALRDREPAVAVAVDGWLALQRRQLGDVLHRGVGDVVGVEMQAVVVVDGEVAQRMGVRGGRDAKADRRGRAGEGKRRDEPPAPGAAGRGCPHALLLLLIGLIGLHGLTANAAGRRSVPGPKWLARKDRLQNPSARAGSPNDRPTTGVSRVT